MNPGLRDAPPVVVGSRNWITPAYELEEYFFPSKTWIVDAIHEQAIDIGDFLIAINGEELKITETSPLSDVVERLKDEQVVTNKSI